MVRAADLGALVGAVVRARVTAEAVCDGLPHPDSKQDTAPVTTTTASRE
ncbi:MAG: hypothetical protein M3Z46_02205 [Actinomycetota bacterium]|nr:hypothetical protein [Actinomycetota bacterium]